MKQYSSLPLRAQEDVIEEFGVSRKYTYLLIGAGLVTIVAGVLVSLSRADVATALSSGAGVLAPLLAGALWVGLLLIGLYLGGVGLYLQLAYQYFLTNQRVIQSVGLFAKRSATSEYSQINDIVVRQDFINRLFLGTGTIGISTPGTAAEEYQLINVDRPNRRAELIRDLIRSSAGSQIVDKYLVAHLMVKNGLMATEQEALDKLDLSVGKDPAAEATFGVISPAYQKHNEDYHGASTGLSNVSSQGVPNPKPIPVIQRPNERVEDLLGDGVDDSDRLRAAQRKLDS